MYVIIKYKKYKIVYVCYVLLLIVFPMLIDLLFIKLKFGLLSYIKIHPFLSFLHLFAIVDTGIHTLDIYDVEWNKLVFYVSSFGGE